MKQVYFVERRTNVNTDMTVKKRMQSGEENGTGSEKELNVFSPVKYGLSPSCCPSE